uniref:helix-turn-helix domain-containing protein n=1 Tax=Nocardia sp. NRRL WC-3656 TaxID=1463824 RepID=UPI0012DF15F0
RGLPMMAAAADESGITTFDDGSGKSSWFELHRPHPEGDPTTPAEDTDANRAGADPTDNSFDTMAQWLMADRKRRELSRPDIAARMGRSESWVTSIELGRLAVTADYLREYAAAVDLSEQVVRSAVARFEPRLADHFADSIPQPTEDRFRTIGEWFVALREHHGWTAKTAAGRIGLHATAIRRTEKGQQRVTLNYLRGVGSAYGLPDETLRAAARRFAPELSDYLTDSVAEPTDPRYRTLNQWLTAVRKQHGWTIGQLADRMDVSVFTVREVEGGGTVTPDFLRAFAAALSIPDETLLLAERRFTTPDPTEFESIGDWLGAVRERHDLDQTQLGALMGRHRTAVSMVENGRRRPGLGYLRDIVDALSISDAELVSALLFFDLPLANHFRDPIPDPTEPEFRTLGDWLLVVREQHGWTQKRLAARMGRGHEAVLKAEKDIAVTRNHLRAFGKALGIPRATLHAATLRFTPHLADPFSATAPDPRDPRFETIGDWLTANRLRRIWTQQEVADRAGLSKKRVWQAEHSESLPEELLHHIAGALGIPEQMIAVAQRRFTVPDPNDPAFDTLGDWLRANRERFGWSRQELANRINDHRVAIWDAEDTNRPIGPRLLRDLRIALGIPIEIMQDALRRFAPELQDYFGTSIPRARDRASIGEWVTAVRQHHGLTKKDLATRMERHQRTVADVENGGRATLDFLRRLRDSIDMPREILREAVEQFLVPGTPEERPEDTLFWQLIDAPVGSSDETRIRNTIFEQFDWIAIAAARRWNSLPESVEDLSQRFREAILGAIRNHVPGGPPFAAHAWRSVRGAMLSSYFESRFPNLDRPTRLLVVRVYTFVNRHVEKTGRRPEVDQIAAALDLAPTEVRGAQQLIAGKTSSLDANAPGMDRPRQVADPTLATADVEFATTVRAALQDLPDPATAELVVGALMQGLSPDEVEARLNISPETFQQLTLEVSEVLRTVFARPTDEARDDDEPPTADSEQGGRSPGQARQQTPRRPRPGGMDQPAPGPDVSFDAPDTFQPRGRRRNRFGDPERHATFYADDPELTPDAHANAPKAAEFDETAAPIGSRPQEGTREQYTVRAAGAALGPSGREGERTRTHAVAAERH